MSGTAQLPAPGTPGPAARAGATQPIGTLPAAGTAVQVAGSPVQAQAMPGSAARGVHVRVLAHAAAAAAGVRGVMFTAAAAAGRGGRVRISLSYARFNQVSGGNYGLSLGLFELPACALTTPAKRGCQAQRRLGFVNDWRTKAVSATVRLPAVQPGGLVLAADPAPDDDGGGLAGTYSATSLRASGTWAEGGSSGAFTYSYPMTAPPAAGGLEPEIGLDYDSNEVNGQTAATQEQASWAGDGWSTPQSYIEQSFTTCADDPEGSAAPQPTQDQCYGGPVLTLSQDGSSDPLICGTKLSYTTSGTCTASDDEGQVITHHVGSGNGSGTKFTDYWTVTTRDGTTYYYGLNELPGWASGDPATDSVDSEPVFSAHKGDPCYEASTFHSCVMAYRWKLDYETDVHGNAIAFYYDQATNAYNAYGSTGAVAYVRDSYLDHIDYGFTAGNAYTGKAPDEIDFAVEPRCVAAAPSPCPAIGTDPSAYPDSDYPDVPYLADYCATGASGCPTGPTFWSMMMLSGITTEQYNGTSYVPVDSWALTDGFPSNQDNTLPSLWLTSIAHTGSDTTTGSAVTLNKVSFQPIAEPNRVDPADGPALFRNRIHLITTETGSVITVNYELPDPCSTTPTQSPSDNTDSCFPVYWAQYTGSNPDWFNQWAVASVSQSDPSGGSGGLFTSYQYASPAWHYDDNLMVEPQYRTYGQWRGYQDVKTFTGTGPDAHTETETTYYQGMSDDNGSATVTLTDSQGGTHDDNNQLYGDALETTDYDYANSKVVEDSTIYSYWISPAVASGLTAGQDTQTADATGLVEQWSRQAITDSGSTTWRATETDTSYDATSSDPDFGLPLFVYDHGDVSQPSQATCTSTTYTAPNTSENLVGLVAEVEVDAVPCGGSDPDGASAPTTSEVNALSAPAGVSRPADVLSDIRTYYDDPPVLGSNGLAQPTNATWPQAAPSNEDPSVVQQASDYTGGAFTYITKTATAYDSYGRSTATYDTDGNETATSYTMTAGSTTAEKVTNALGQSTTTTYDPLRGIPLAVTDPNGIITTLHYDGLGRLTDVWGYSRPTTDPANEIYSYNVSNTGPSVVTTQQLNNEGGYVTSEQLYDALLRLRQTQTPTPQGGILVSDNFYDTHGWTVKTYTSWWDSAGGLSDSIVYPCAPGQTGCTSGDDSVVPDLRLMSYDGLGRQILDTDEDDGSIRSETATAYYGDRVTTVPGVPGPGTPATNPPSVITGASSTVTDALGRTTELDKYTSAPSVAVGSSSPGNGDPVVTTVSIAGGTTQATGYSYNTRGELGTITDNGEQWTKSYNLLGQITGTTDPDGGATSMTYDGNGNLLTSTDADGHTISYTYDALNRKTGEYDGPNSSSPPIATWAYDNSNDAVAGMTDPIGQLTTETSYSGGQPYTIQQQGFNAYGEPAGETVTLPSTEGALAPSGGYTLSYTYGGDNDELLKTIYPASPAVKGVSALPAETTTQGYETGFDLPDGLGSTLAAYGQQVTYTAWSQVGEEEIGSIANHAYVTNTYDPNTGNLTASQVANTAVSTTPYDTTSYAYDATGDIISTADTRYTPSTGTQSETQCYDYNTLDQLTQAWTATDDCAANPASNGGATVGDGISGGAYWSSWTFNPMGQRTSETDDNLSGGTNTTTSYSYSGNGASQPDALTSTSTTGPSGSSSASYSYDADGNTLTRDLSSGNQKLTWTDDGKLASDTTSAGTTSYVYDADGNVLLQKDPGQTTLYLFGGAEQIVLNTSTGAITGTRFIALPGGGEVVRYGASTSYDFELANQQNTGLLTLDNTLQNPQWRQFTPYGAPRGTAPSNWPDTNGFLGKPTDTDTGLTMIGARAYDPAIGQFLSLDPVLNPDEPADLNGYTYADDNPITDSDPTGLMINWGGGVNPCSGASYKCAPQGGRNVDTDPIPGYSSASTYRNPGAYTLLGAIAVPEDTPHLQAVKARFLSIWSPEQSQYTGSPSAAIDAQAAALGQVCFGSSLCGSALIDRIDHLVLNLVNCGAKVYGIMDLMTSGDGGMDSDIGSTDENRTEAMDAAVQGEVTEFNEESGDTCQSFTPSTQVLLSDGKTQPIADLHPGDKVLTTNTHTGKTDAETVAAVLVHHDTDLYDLAVKTSYGSAIIHTTAHHLFWSQTTHAWIQAAELKPGTHLHTLGVSTATVTTGYTPRIDAAWMWDLTVPPDHDFYIIATTTASTRPHAHFAEDDDTAVLVHNSSSCGPRFAVDSDGVATDLANPDVDPATGVPSANGKGAIYDVPTGMGLNSRVTQVRIMNPVDTGAYQYPNGYVVYMNITGQTVNPLTGQTVANSNPYAHIPLP
jgi:RHS repeat-associated protein